MFASGSPYSPFFTSGLMSISHVPQRRGSLPTDSTSTYSTIEEGASAFYFTLQPKRDTWEYRSFLSLDLAESHSLRSVSIKRKSSTLLSPLSTSQSPLSIHRPLSRVPSSQLAPPHSSLRLRRSRDSLRSIPSPKPAPSITLPDLPISDVTSSSASSVVPTTPPRLPSITVGASLGITIDRAAHSAPSLPIPSSNPLPAADKFSKRNSVSTVSASIRRVNRSQALARLEGRTNSTRQRRRAANKPTARNFMSMSDDDDDDEGDDQELELDNVKVTLSAILEPEDIVLPPRSPPRLSGSKSVPVGGRFPSLSTSSSKQKSPRSKTKDWFPLKSFIDLQGEEEMSRWSWRSFIEVASVS